MDPSSRLTSKCQTTIPRAVRETLSLVPGDTIVYEIDGDSVRMRKQAALDLSYRRWCCRGATLTKPMATPCSRW
jgi:bifunctional DNA-binding transcriptional regulator/antitoxin component of YhaV-PrlF toxin-antitoxin module